MESIIFHMSDQPHFPDMQFSVDLQSYISDLHFVLGVLLKTPRGFIRGACVLHGYDTDLIFYAHSSSRSDVQLTVVAGVIK